MPLDCLFCRIARGDLEAAVLFREPEAMAFLDIAPAAPGHTLVIPTRHAVTLFDLTPEEAPALWAALQRAGQALREGLGASGLNLLQANGPAAGQTVEHLHFHLVPRTPGDGLHLHVPAAARPVSRDELQAVAARVRPHVPAAVPRQA